MIKDENLLLYSGILLCGLLCGLFCTERSGKTRTVEDRLVGEWCAEAVEMWTSSRGSERFDQYEQLERTTVLTLDKGGRGTMMEIPHGEDSLAWSYDDGRKLLTYRYDGAECVEFAAELEWKDDRVLVWTERSADSSEVFRYVFERVTTP